MTVRDATPHPPAAEDPDDKHRLTALEGLAALSLDALSSVAYGPEAIVIVLAAAGTVGLAYTLPVTIAIVVLLTVLVISYRQVIEAFPGGGGAYAVAKRHLGQKASLLAGASLTVDYVLNAAVGVSAGVEALTSAFHPLYADRVWLCLGVLAVITAANMWGVAESARLFIVPTLLFILAIAVVIVGGLVRSHPVVPPSGQLPAGGRVGRHPAAAQGVRLGLLGADRRGGDRERGARVQAAAGPAGPAHRDDARDHPRPDADRHRRPDPEVPRLPVADRDDPGPAGRGRRGERCRLLRHPADHDRSAGPGREHFFGGLPVLASLLARDNFLPHVFALKGERQVFRYGVGVLAAAAAVLLVVPKGSTQALIPVFAIGVFVGFTLSQTGMVRHWHEQHGPGWVRRAFINGLGAVLTTAALAIELVSKFTEGAWLVVIIIPALVLLFTRIHRAYEEIGGLLELGRTPPPPERAPALAVVPVRGLSRLTREAISAALSLADEVVAVTICYHDLEDQQADASFRAPVGRVGSRRAAGHAAHRAPRARSAHRGIPARPGAGGSEPPRRGGDPRGPARALVAMVPA